ncbi:MAG: ArsA-related P-loop ATPase [Dehalococcoidia bacterium]
MRIVLFAGGGGAGRTAVAAATAVHAARQGYRPLLLGSGNDLWRTLALSPSERPVALDGGPVVEGVDARRELSARRPALDRWLRALLGRFAADEILPGDVVALLPTLGDALTLATMAQRAYGRGHDLLVVDGPPLADLPAMLTLLDGATGDSALPTEFSALRLARPLVARLAGLPTPDPDADVELRALAGGLRRAASLLAGADAVVRLVCPPEPLPLARTHAAYGGVRLCGFHVDEIVVNRVFPRDETGSAVSEWRRGQMAAIAEARPRLAPAHLRPAPYVAPPLVGWDALAALGRQIYCDADPAAEMAPRPRTGLAPNDDGPGWSLRLAAAPLLDDLAVTQRGDTIAVRLGAYRRTVALPAELSGAPCVGARLEGAALWLRFGVPHTSHQ